MQIQGTNAGKYEFGTITSKGTGYLNLLQNLVNTYYQGGTSKAQVILVPHFNMVSGSLTTQEWNGVTGGVLVFRALNTNNASIDMSTKGFKGGYGNDSAGHVGGINCPNSGATQGASYSGPGGCGYSANGGGGGGAIGEGSGGGGSYGGYGANGAGPGMGFGGGIYGSADLSTMFLGSGGGGGSWGTNPYGGGRSSIQGNDYSGQGGGAVFIASRTIQNTSISTS